MEKRVGRRQDFGLVDHVDAHGLEGPGLGLVSDPAFGHHGDRHGIHNLLNPDRIGHARNAAGRPDVRRNALEGHHRDGARFFRDRRLLRVRDVHHDAPFLHLREPALQQFGAESHPRQVEVEGDSIPPGRSYGPWVFLFCSPESREERLRLRPEQTRPSWHSCARHRHLFRNASNRDSA